MRDVIEESGPGRPDLAQHRAKIAHVLLVGLAVLGLVAYVPSVWLAVQVGAWVIAVVDTVVYAAILAVLAFGRHSYRLQAGVVVGASYTLGLVLSLLLGPAGAGPLWLLATPLAAAILFDRRAALGALLLVTVTIAGVTLLSFDELLPWAEQAVTSPVLWVVLAANALLLAGALTLAVATLIAELQQEMSDRHRAEQQLRQAEKLQAIGTLAAGIAHDFNNLLTPILSATEMARADSEPGSAPRQALDQAIAAALAGRVLVRRILAFSRPSGEGRTPMRASEAFRDAVRLLRASIPGSIDVELHTTGDGIILLSAAEVHQVVLNLGTNAQSAMPAGGRLDFRLLAADGDGIDWHGAATRPDRVVRLEVSDTGVGMSPDVAARIFEPFFTTDQDRGTGIGLATVHGIVSSAGGQIGCHSQTGVGTTFTLDFPAVDPAAAAAGSNAVALADCPPDSSAGCPAEPMSLPGSGRHIVVVDDEQPVRDVAERVLLRQGYRVTALADADAALALLRQDPCDVALLLSDLHMPGTTGLELAVRVRAEQPAVGIILMSGLVDEELKQAAQDAGVDAVIAKPFRLHELTEAVSTVCDA